ncbi:uncharacterized protein LOC101891862 [Musca domestica]|uniref:Uncharacterized protein LOC101891862 n=1 Tax=Musca domestica TaxID=7370 RepID=A0A9J7CM26_MUSDO|nr:uncharacterized protein LOC101891862 [Musca domestica]
MDRCRFAFVIGIINVIYYAVSTIVFTAMIIKTELDKKLVASSSPYILGLCCGLIMVSVSILMIVGAAKSRHSFIAPWVLLTGFGLVIGTFYLLIFGYTVPIWELFNYITFIASQSVSCYSIYLFWKDTKNGVYNNDLHIAELSNPPPYVHSSATICTSYEINDAVL